MLRPLTLRVASILVATMSLASSRRSRTRAITVITLEGCVCVDDGGHQVMPNNILRLHTDNADVFDPVQHIDGARQSRLLMGQINLGEVTGHNHCCTKTEARQKHLHLRGRRVLGFIQNDESIVEGPPTHIGQRGDLDNP